MRLLLVALLLSTSCADACTAVGGGALRQTALHGGAAVQGPSMSPPVDDGEDTVVGIDWPFTPTLLWEAGKETAFADNDPVETPSQFGTQTDVLPTQGTLGARLAYESPCDVGPAVPCFYADGGDRWVDAIIRSSLAYLHDGTGMTCYLLVEMLTGGTSVGIIGTGGFSPASERGFVAYRDVNRLIRMILSNGSAQVGNTPTGGDFGLNRTAAAVFVHGTARTNDQDVQWRGPVSAPTGSNVNYSATPSTSDSFYNLTIGARPQAVAASWMTGHIFAIACENAIHDATMISDTWAAIEAVTGALPQ